MAAIEAFPQMADFTGQGKPVDSLWSCGSCSHAHKGENGG